MSSSKEFFKSLFGASRTEEEKTQPPVEVEPDSKSEPDHSVQLNVLGLSLEFWALEQRVRKVLSQLPGKEAKIIESTLSRMRNEFEKCALTFEDPNGQPYSDGDRVEVICFEPNPSASGATVVQTLKPAIYFRNQLVKAAEVIVAVPADDARANSTPSA